MTATWKKTLRFGIRFPLQFPKLKWFSKPIYYHDSTVEVKNNLARVNISGTFYYEDGIIFEKSIRKIQVALPLCLDDWDGSNVLRAFLCQLLWAISLRGIGFEISFERRWAILIWISSGLSALENQFFPSKLPTHNRFSKAPSASSMLILSRESKFALHFSSVRGRVTAIFNSNLNTWG